MPLFENHVPLVLRPYNLVFLKVCPKLGHMTHFGFHGNRLKCCKVAQIYFFYKEAQTKGTVQMSIILGSNGSANTKIALYTYPKLTLNKNYVGSA